MATKQQIQRFFEAMSGLHLAISGSKLDPLRKFKLSPPQVKVLYLINHGDQTVNQIARQMNISSSAVTQMIEGLVKSGYLERRTDSKDRRVVHVLFTERGKKRFEEFRKIHFEHMEKLLSALSDHEMETLISLPEKIARALKKNT